MNSGLDDRHSGAEPHERPPARDHPSRETSDMLCGLSNLFARMRGEESSLEACAVAVATAQMASLYVRPDLLFRLGVPRIDGQQPIAIARFAARCV